MARFAVRAAVFALLSCAALLVATVGTDDGLIGKLQDAIGDANLLQLRHVRTGVAAGKLHPGDSTAALRERCIGPLQAATDAASATRALRPAGGVWPGDKWLTNPAIDLIDDAALGATEIAVSLRADGSTGLGSGAASAPSTAGRMAWLAR